MGNIYNKMPVSAKVSHSLATAENDFLIGMAGGGAFIKKTLAQTKAILEIVDPLVYKGVIDCAANPNYPAADAGHVYFVSVAGKIGGASGTTVDVGDKVVCNTDATAAGDQATGGTKWNIVQGNLEYEISTAEIKMNGAVAVGTSAHVPRADHVHASDTTKTDKVTPAAASNLAGPTAAGNLEDSLVPAADAAAAISASHTQNTDTGTTSAAFQLDNDASGPKLKHDTGSVAIRNAADDADAPVSCAALTCDEVTTDRTAIPIVELRSSDCTDNDINASLSAQITDGGSGTEDADVYLAQQVAGVLTNILIAVAGGNLRIGVNQPVEIVNGLKGSIETVTCVSDAGTASLTKISTIIVTDGDEDEDTVSLADGTAGQVKMFSLKTLTHANDTVNVTPTNMSGGTKIVFTAVGQGCTMMFNGVDWDIVGNNGGTIS